MLAGGSSGAVAHAAMSYTRDCAPGTRIGMVFMDRGERYLDTVYNDDWVIERIPGRPRDRSQPRQNRRFDTVVPVLPARRQGAACWRPEATDFNQVGITLAPEMIKREQCDKLEMEI